MKSRGRGGSSGIRAKGSRDWITSPLTAVRVGNVRVCRTGAIVNSVWRRPGQLAVACAAVVVAVDVALGLRLVSLVMMAILVVLSFIATKVILAGIDINDEVVKQGNIAIGIIQAIIYISVALFLSELIG